MVISDGLAQWVGVGAVLANQSSARRGIWRIQAGGRPRWSPDGRRIPDLTASYFSARQKCECSTWLAAKARTLPEQSQSPPCLVTRRTLARLRNRDGRRGGRRYLSWLSQRPVAVQGSDGHEGDLLSERRAPRPRPARRGARRAAARRRRRSAAGACPRGRRTRAGRDRPRGAPASPAP
jgi:hypothetical protein